MREGIVKHETEYDLSNLDNEEFDADKRGSIEAQIANMADELAYNAHDLDDGLRAGLVVPGQLEALGLWKMLKDSIGWKDEGFTEQIRHRLIRRLIGIEIDDVINSTGEMLRRYDLPTADALQRLPHNVVVHSEEINALNRELKGFLFENLYRHYRVVRMAVKAERFVTEMFETFIEEPEQLPPTVQALIDKRGLYRAVTDYIAGMTDRYALEEWQRLFNPFTRP